LLCIDPVNGYRWVNKGPRLRGEMRLTQKQELALGRYLQEVERRLDTLPGHARQQVLDRLKLRLVKEFDKATNTTLTDEEVRAALLRFGAPSAVAQGILAGEQPPDARRLTKDEPRWLGVCATLAARLDVEVKRVRLLAVLSGLLAGPVMVIVYLAAYFEMYFTSGPEDFPRIDKWKLFKSAAGTLGGATALFVGSKGMLALINHAYLRFLQKGPPVLGNWGWLEMNGTWLFVLVLFWVMPIAVLSGLPVPNKWDLTGKRIVQAGLALYALALCLGIASALSGILLLVVEDMAGTHVSPGELIDTVKRIVSPGTPR